MAKAKVIPIHIEAVQFTPGRDPVLIHYAGKGIESGPLAKASIFSTTQTKLAGVPTDAKPEDVVWGDTAVVAALEEHLAESGIAAKVELPEPEAPPAKEETTSNAEPAR